jgi:hypothetical protein
MTLTVKRLSSEWISGGDGHIAEEVRIRRERVRDTIALVINLGKPISKEEFNEL